MSKLRLALLLTLTSACADKAPPTWAAGASLDAEDVQGSVLTLRWPEAEDNRGVASYRVMQDDREIAIVTARTFRVEGLADGQIYQFGVEALDEAGNHGERLHAELATADATAPQWPVGARLRMAISRDAEGKISSTQLVWPAANDTVGVTEYRVEAPGDAANVVAATTVTFAREVDTTTIRIIARDAAGNESAPFPVQAAQVVAPGEALAPALAAMDAVDTSGQLALEVAPGIAAQGATHSSLQNLRIRPIIEMIHDEQAFRQGETNPDKLR